MNNVPVIDVSALREQQAEPMRDLAAQIGEAARTIGFFTIKNHGVAPAVSAQMFESAATFFNLPQAAKDAVAIKRFENYLGYGRLGQEQVDPEIPADFKEYFNFRGEASPLDGPSLRSSYVGANSWPALPGFREDMLAYYEAVNAVALLLHRAIALDVGADPDEFLRCFERPLTTCSVLHYPPHAQAFDRRGFGAAPHTDFGGLTLLAQDDTGGLEVQRLDGTWIAVDPVPGTFVCNIGDALMRWTNDVYKSNPHRVINRSNRERFSAAFFCDPSGDTNIAAFPSCVSEERPVKYEPITYEELFRLRVEPVAAGKS